MISLYLRTLKFPISKNPEEPLVADRHSVINQAVLKPELKVSDFKSAVFLALLAKKEQSSEYHTAGLGFTTIYQEK